MGGGTTWPQWTTAPPFSLILGSWTIFFQVFWPSVKATSASGSFLWLGYLERLAWQELHNKKEAGGLGVSCIFTRGQALLSEQLCHQMAAGGFPATHLAFGLGQHLAIISLATP
jgi:hypothetical protein